MIWVWLSFWFLRLVGIWDFGSLLLQDSGSGIGWVFLTLFGFLGSWGLFLMIKFFLLILFFICTWKNAWRQQSRNNNSLKWEGETCLRQRFIHIQNSKSRCVWQQQVTFSLLCYFYFIGIWLILYKLTNISTLHTIQSRLVHHTQE